MTERQNGRCPRRIRHSLVVRLITSPPRHTVTPHTTHHDITQCGVVAPPRLLRRRRHLRRHPYRRGDIVVVLCVVAPPHPPPPHTRPGAPRAHAGVSDDGADGEVPRHHTVWCRGVWCGPHTHRTRRRLLRRRRHLRHLATLGDVGGVDHTRIAHEDVADKESCRRFMWGWNGVLSSPLTGSTRGARGCAPPT
jgi:hypothetical protein